MSIHLLLYVCVETHTRNHPGMNEWIYEPIKSFISWSGGEQGWLGQHTDQDEMELGHVIRAKRQTAHVDPCWHPEPQLAAPATWPVVPRDPPSTAHLVRFNWTLQMVFPFVVGPTQPRLLWMIFWKGDWPLGAGVGLLLLLLLLISLL